MIKRIDHIAIAVQSVDDGVALFRNLFGLEAAHIETLPDLGVKAAQIPIGDIDIELLEPIDPEGVVAKFLQSRGEGIHHICLEVDAVDEELKSLAAKGVALIDKVGRKGLAARIGFIHPKATKGVLIELAQKV